ncbi:putative flavoprotein involved in K+ transport [Pseudonocardia hierapolitana]|uniref:Putative flavoprotein involved in K+ transport n=1 Tax=Pseudonocardia hierapolitana TaxID=1128676 RepID=A0A561T183_9PSEU|nr:NAD(P)/FAD-dependent oxidoreductase [Pseudonocardia hierapolitana]TWF80861.1 putative flavoprotein involved in K+ transport [Pseudonocardia hierapolitana]
MVQISHPLVIIGAGQSGLAAAQQAQLHGLEPLVLEARERPTGSWPDYYDSLRLFSPARFSGMPDAPFPGDLDHYPTRDEVSGYLTTFADRIGAEIRTSVRVTAVHAQAGGFRIETAAGDEIEATGLVAATGSFNNPYRPSLPGQEHFPGRILHAAEYRSPEPFAGQRVVVVGGGNSAVQIAYDLAEVATTTVASRHPLQFVDQRPDGRDIHHRLTAGFDDLPLEWLAPLLTATLVLDPGKYGKAMADGLLDRRPMFTAFGSGTVEWTDGTREQVDAVIFATGYRPALDYLQPLGALEHGAPRHVGGISTTRPGLAYTGLELQRSFSSNTLRGVSRDAAHVMGPLAAHVRGAYAAVA